MFHVTIIGDKCVFIIEANNEAHSSFYHSNVAHDMEVIASHIGETDGFDMSGNNKYAFLSALMCCQTYMYGD